jgi:hypothetical protein
LNVQLQVSALDFFREPTIFYSQMRQSFNPKTPDLQSGDGVKLDPAAPVIRKGELSIREAPIADLRLFISSHYLRKRPAVVVLALEIIFQSQPVGMVIYSLPPRECSTRFGGVTWELARLYLIDSVPRNAESWAISASVRHIRKTRPEVRFLVSYADPSAGHSGTIYRAANWRFDGMTDAGRKTPRCDYVDGRTGKKYGRKSHLPADARVVRVPRVSKYRFVFST